MKLIAWDTSSKTGALAALEWDEPQDIQYQANHRFDLSRVNLVAEFTLNVDATHSEQLLWGIHQTLQAARWGLKDIDVFGVGVGPGSFTGLRIGVTTARTLAHICKKPLVGISSLAALARPVSLHFGEKVRCLETQTVVVAVTDACQGEVFALWGYAPDVARCCTWTKKGCTWSLKVQEQVIQPEALVDGVKKKFFGSQKKTRWVLIGEGGQRYLEVWGKLPQLKRQSYEVPLSCLIQGRSVGILAWQAYQGGLSPEALDVYPRYLRASNAELKRKEVLWNRLS